MEGELDMEDLSEDELLRYGDDGTVEERKWVSAVHGIASMAWPKSAKKVRHGKMKMCRSGRGTIADVETRNAFTKSIVRRSTDFLRHVVSEEG